MEGTHRTLAGSHRVETPEWHGDPNGIIRNLFTGGCHVAVIHSVRGAIRSNHYHREDSHWLYVVEGEMVYWERPVGSTAIPEPKRIGPGQMVYTPAQVEHATYFPTETTLVSISARPRDKASHEADVVRVKFIARAQAEGWT